MALTNQPYLPLYINDWLSSTKLKSCSAQAHGIMINIMALMHKEDDYGIILLKQKFKQTDKQILNFASQFAKVLPFDLLEIEVGLSELLDENCLILDGDCLKCNRMVKDADISFKRSQSGSKGGNATMNTGKNKPKKFAQAKIKANTDIDIEYDNEINKELFIKNSDFEKIFKKWLEYKKSRREKYKSKISLETAYKKLLKLSNNDSKIAEEIIDVAIGNNWAGFFELKKQNDDPKKREWVA